MSRALRLRHEPIHEDLRSPPHQEIARTVQEGRISVETASSADDFAATSEEISELRASLPRIRVDAFVAADDLAAVIGRAADDWRAARAEFAIHAGGFEQAVAHYREHPPASLVLIEDTGSAEQLEWKIEALADYCPPSTRLVVIGTRNDIVLYRRLTRLGVSDYLVQPFRPLDLLESIASIFGEAEQAELGTVLAFVGTRGGAGASTVAHNVAAYLTRSNEAATLLIDADPFGTAGLQFDVASPHGFLDAVREGESLDRSTLDRLVHWRDKRLGLLVAPERPEPSAAADPDAMRRLIEQARRLAKFVVLDLPHGGSPATIEALASADRIAIVATPDLPSLRNARTLLDMIEKRRPNDAPPEIVLNRMPQRGKALVPEDDYVRVLNRQMAAVIPLDPSAASAEMKGRVLIEDAPGSLAATALRSLAARMSGRTAKTASKLERKGLLGRLLRVRGR